MRLIGYLTVLFGVALAVAHFSGHLNLSAEVDMTQKGQMLMSQSVEGARSLTNKGLIGVQELTNEGFDALVKKEEAAPTKQK